MSGMMLMTVGQGLIEANRHWENTCNDTALPLNGRDFVLLLSVYSTCSLVAGLASTLVHRDAKLILPLIVGVILTLAGLYNCLGMVHPGWFMFANLFIYIPFTLAGYFLVRKKGKNANG